MRRSSLAKSSMEITAAAALSPCRAALVAAAPGALGLASAAAGVARDSFDASIMAVIIFGSTRVANGW